MLLTGVWVVLGVITVGLALLTVYLVALTVAALFASTQGPPAGPSRRRFAVLVPAPHEEALLGRLLRSLQQLEYPRDGFDICVVADNCTDATASIAQGMGV